MIASRTGRMLYVNPDDFNASDLISNNGNSPTRPFKTIQRALLEVARFSYIQGQNNDKYDQFTINLSPGEYIIDNRPGKANTAEVPELSDQSNFDILDPANDLVKFNSTEGGLVVPRGTSLVGMDLRKTRVRPRYVPNPSENSIARTSIFKVTGACYFWQFSLFDALPTSDVSGNGGVYNDPASIAIVNSDYSHHKVTCFTYADQSDLDLFYAKAARAFASIPTTPGELESRTQENRIVGPLQQAGQKEIASASVSGALVTIVTDGPHEVFEGQQITIEKVSGSYTDLNGTYYVTSVNNDTELVITENGLTPGSIPSSAVASAIVKAEIDTVDSSSPYIFNCSLRSTYGLCGLWADGSKVSGFKSMVVAQFTGVSLQKDDNAFVKFTETLDPPQFVKDGGASDAVSLHQDSSRGVYYRGDATTGWRHYHIRVSNNAFIQSVSVFAVGYAEQHLIESGGDYSITNSNSNFGTQALVADGFRPDSFTLDKKGKITHIVPPQALSTLESDVQYYPLDVQKSRAGLSANTTGTKLFLFEQRDASEAPIFNINDYKIGGKKADRIYVKLSNPATSALDVYEAEIDPSGIEEHEIFNVNTADNTFTTNQPNEFETATPIRIYSSTGYLPLGMESNRLYYAIKVTNTTFKIAPSEEDARAGADLSNPLASNSIVNIRSTRALGSTLTVKAFVSDTNPELPRFDVEVNSSLETFSTGTFPHGFSTGDKVFFRRRVIADVPTTGQLPQVQQSGTVQTLSLTTEYFVYVVDAYTFKISDTESNANNGIEINIDAPGDVNQIKVYRNIQKSPLRYDPTQENWYLAVKSNTNNGIHQVLTNPNSIYTASTITNTENIFFKRVSDDRQLADRTYRLRYVIPKTELNARPPIVGYVIARRTDANNVIKEYNTNSNTNQTAPFDRIYFIYRSDTILRHIPGEQDGIYYLTVLLADVAPTGDQFNASDNEFGFLKYSQDVSKIYPDLDKDNHDFDPPAAVSVADNLVHGLVYQNDDRSSITKEAVATFVADAGYTPALNALTGKATSGQENRLIAFNSNIPEIEIELRRTSQVRAGNQTFEYTGFGSGNYSTGFPSKQEIVLNDKEVLYSQSQRRRAGVVFYSGLNAYGDLYVGNQKINAITGEVEILDKPILRVAGSAVAVNEEYVPYVAGTKNVYIAGNLATNGGQGNNLPNNFDNLTKCNRGAEVSNEKVSNRALISHDLCLRKKVSDVSAGFASGNNKQFILNVNNTKPIPGNEGEFPGDIRYKPTINRKSRHEGYIYVGTAGNTDPTKPFIGDYRHIGLIGVGHLTSIEESHTETTDQTVQLFEQPEPYITTGKFGINQTAPTASLHVGTGDVLFDNDLTVSGDIAANGGNLTSTASTFNYTTTSDTVNFATSAETVNVAASTATAAGRSGGTSITNLKSDKLKIYSDIELVGQYDSTTDDTGPRTLEITTTAETTNFLTAVTTANIASVTMNTFTGATNISMGANTGTTTINHNLVVTKDLTVNGTTTYVNTEVVDLTDPIISVGGGGSGADTPSSAANGVRGMELRYYKSNAANSGFMGLDVNSLKYIFKTGLGNIGTSNSTSGGDMATVRVGKLESTGDIEAYDGYVEMQRIKLNPVEGAPNKLSYTTLGNEFNNEMQEAVMKHALPIASVIMYSTSADTSSVSTGHTTVIPRGYAPCDGGTYTSRKGINITTPDLRGRFVLGQSYTSPAGAANLVTPAPTQVLVNPGGGDGNGTMGTISENQKGGHKYKDTENATDLNGTSWGIAIDTSQFTIDSHELTRPQIPKHRHGMRHGHNSAELESVSFEYDNQNVTVNVGGTGQHAHSMDGSQWDHSHNVSGGGTDDDSGDTIPGGDSGQNFQNRTQQTPIHMVHFAQLRPAPIGFVTMPNEGDHGHTASVGSGAILNHLTGITAAIPISAGINNYGGGSHDGYTGGATSNNGQMNDLNDADTGQGHTHGTSGTLPINNKNHKHQILGVAPPWYALTFIMKL